MLHLEPSDRKRHIRSAVEAADLRKLFARGPFVTPGQKQIFVVDGCILTDEELIDLWRAGDLTPEGVRSFAQSRTSPESSRDARGPKPKVKSAAAGRS